MHNRCTRFDVDPHVSVCDTQAASVGSRWRTSRTTRNSVKKSSSTRTSHRMCLRHPHDIPHYTTMCIHLCIDRTVVSSYIPHDYHITEAEMSHRRKGNYRSGGAHVHDVYARCLTYERVVVADIIQSEVVRRALAWSRPRLFFRDNQHWTWILTLMNRIAIHFAIIHMPLTIHIHVHLMYVYRHKQRICNR